MARDSKEMETSREINSTPYSSIYFRKLRMRSDVYNLGIEPLDFLTPLFPIQKKRTVRERLAAENDPLGLTYRDKYRRAVLIEKTIIWDRIQIGDNNKWLRLQESMLFFGCLRFGEYFYVMPWSPKGKLSPKELGPWSDEDIEELCREIEACQ